MKIEINYTSKNDTKALLDAIDNMSVTKADIELCLSIMKRLPSVGDVFDVDWDKVVTAYVDKVMQRMIDGLNSVIDR